MNILNIGSCNIDYVYRMDHIVLPGETQTVLDMNIFAGGKGLNQSIAAARAGGKVYHAGCIGTDGEMLADIMKKSGVNLKYINYLDARSGHAVIQVDKSGENSIIVSPCSNGMLTEDYVSRVIDSFDAGDILILQNEINLLPFIIDKAYSRGLKIALNPSPCNAVIKELDFRKISFLILNGIEAAYITGAENPQKSMDYLLKKYPGICALITLGKKGGICGNKEKRFEFPAFAVRAVDTTAAGDTFTGYFLAEVSFGSSPERAVKIAAAASALAVTVSGAEPSIPVSSKVLSAFPELKTY